MFKLTKQHAWLHYSVAGILAIAALVHLVRILLNLPLILGGRMLPMWASWIGLVVAVVLAGLLWFSAEK